MIAINEIAYVARLCPPINSARMGARLRLSSCLAAGLLLAISSGCYSKKEASTSVTVVSKPTVVVPEAAAASATVTPDALVFPASAGESLGAVEPGSILVSGLGEGFLRKVVSVDSSNGQLTLRTENASLDEVVTKGQLIEGLEGAFATQEQPLNVDLAGTSLASGGALSITIVSGRINYEPETKLSMMFDDGLQSLDWSFSGLLTANLALQAKCTASLDEQGDVSLFAPVSKRFYFTIGPVPVVAKVSVEMKVAYSASLSAAQVVNDSISCSGPLAMGLHYENGNITTPYTADVSFNATAPEFASHEVDASLKVDIKPKLLLTFYGVAGPSITIDEWGQIGATVDQSNGQCGVLTYDVSAGLDATARADVHVLSKVLAETKDLVLIQREVALAHGQLGDSMCHPDAGSADGGEADGGYPSCPRGSVTELCVCNGAFLCGPDPNILPLVERCLPCATNSCPIANGACCTNSDCTNGGTCHDLNGIDTPPASGWGVCN